MIHTLETISLADFIKISMGDVSFAGDKFESEHDKNVAAASMANEYSTIVGGKNLIASINRHNSELNNFIKIELMDACDKLISLDMYREACDVLASMGFRIDSNNKKAIETRINAIRSAAKMKMDLSPKHEEKEIDKDYFIKERIAISTHYKMHIDPEIWKAKEYAFLVKSFCDEMKAYKK